MMMLRKLVRVGPAGWWILFRAQLAILRAHRIVRSSCPGSLTRTTTGEGPPRPSGPGRDDPLPRHAEEHPTTQARRASALAWAVGVMGRRGLAPAECLVESLAVVDLLHRDGLRPGRIRVGVRERDHRFDAHAWVEWDGSVLGDDPATVAEYRSFDGLDVVVPSGPAPGESPRFRTGSSPSRRNP